MTLPRGKTEVAVRRLTPTQALLTFQSSVWQHRVAFDLPGIAHESSDNYFELYPHEHKDIYVEFAEPITVAAIRSALIHHSLVDTY